MSKRGLTDLGTAWIAESSYGTIALLVGLGLVLVVSGIMALWTTAALPSARAAVVSGMAAVLGIAAAIWREARHGAARARRRRAERADLLRITIIGETVAEITHGVNQPLTAIVNYAEGCLLRIKAGNLCTDALVKVLQEIVAAGLQGGVIVRHLSGFLPSRSPHGEAIDIGDCAREAVRAARVGAAWHGISIRLELGTGRPTVRADRQELELSVLGLIETGIDAICETCPGRSELLVETANGTTANDLRMRAATRITAPFFSGRANSPGLGLWISRSIVESLGGELRGAAEGAGGAVFHLALPVEHLQNERVEDRIAQRSGWRRTVARVVSVSIPAPAGARALSWASDNGLLPFSDQAEPGFRGAALGTAATLGITND